MPSRSERSRSSENQDKVVWVSTWSIRRRKADAAQSLLNGGADVLLQNTDSTACCKTAEKNGKYAFGWDSDMSAFAGKCAPRLVHRDWGTITRRRSRT